MEAIYLVMAGVVLYFLADWVVTRIEFAMGRRFEQRTILFFFIFLVLLLVFFYVIRQLAPTP